MNKQQDIQELVSVVEEQAQKIKLLTETIARNDKFHKKELAKLRRLRLTLTSEHVTDIRELKNEILSKDNRIYQLELETAFPKRKFPRTLSTRSYAKTNAFDDTNESISQNRQDGGLQTDSTIIQGCGIHPIDVTDEIFTIIDEQDAFKGGNLHDDILFINKWDTIRCD